MIALKTSLLPYQKEAVDKLAGLKVGALYMEQGTGKTRTALEIVSRRLDAGKVDIVLWLCPCSVKDNLKKDILKHCGTVPDQIIIKGIESISASDNLYVQLAELVTESTIMLIVDESSLVKNPKALRSQRITELASKCKYRMILNGTPVSRTEADLFSQWYILDWRILGYKSFYSFARNHLEYYTVISPSGNEVKTDRVRRVLDKEYLTQKISPYTYQITKAEAELSIPDKEYHSFCFHLTRQQKLIYEKTKDLFLDQVDDFREETIYKLFTALQHVASGRRITSEPYSRMTTENIFSDPEDNPRVQCFLKLVEEKILDEQCIVFCKYQAEIMELETVLDRRGIVWSEFTGRIPVKKRVENLNTFRAGGAQALLANKMCGAYGLNLQFCHNIIFYSNDFDFATRAQAEDRVHRIGQLEVPQIYDIEGVGTIDDFISQNLDGKVSMVMAFKALIEKWKKAKREELEKAGEEAKEDENLLAGERIRGREKTDS